MAMKSKDKTMKSKAKSVSLIFKTHKKSSGNTLNLKPTTISEIAKEWRFTPPNRGMFNGTQPLFVRCNSKGVVNWDVAPVYTASELKGRKYKIII